MLNPLSTSNLSTMLKDRSKWRCLVKTTSAQTRKITTHSPNLLNPAQKAQWNSQHLFLATGKMAKNLLVLKVQCKTSLNRRAPQTSIKCCSIVTRRWLWNQPKSTTRKLKVRALMVRRIFQLRNQTPQLQLLLCLCTLISTTITRTSIKFQCWGMFLSFKMTTIVGSRVSMWLARLTLGSKSTKLARKIRRWATLQDTILQEYQPITPVLYVVVRTMLA